MKRIILLIMTISVGIFAFSEWLKCHGLTDHFILSRMSIPLRLDDYIHNDRGVSFIFIRILHNKFIEYSIDTYRHFVRFWDIQFLVSFISLLGAAGLMFGIYYAFKNADKIIQAMLGLLILLQFLFVFFGDKLNSQLFLAILWILYQVVSLYGFVAYIKGKKFIPGYLTWIGLLILSIWWLYVFHTVSATFCAKI